MAAESWQRAEEATEELIQHIQPTALSEQRRRAVVEYVQRLIKRLLRTEVLPFGSVPLKTYLPDGDIDLTALAVPNFEDSLANEVRLAFEGEQQNEEAEFEVKDVQYIQAEVKLVKCLVQNIVVDISFNQIGGLCTLCFLERVDTLIGKNNLFKRSIILIKAWCYYESRILGAHHGLISTYALETLVLYIFHLFHSSMDGPLAVLYRFLDYYSKFDWDNYCISLYGPISVSSLPELIAEAPENDGGDLLLTKDFLIQCSQMFSDPPRALDNNSGTFPKKHLNIVDPLKENNNLGRSVSKGNFYRIRSAITYGARKLGRILLLPDESIAHEVNMFFTNTWEFYGRGERPDVQDALSSFSDSAAINGSVSSDLNVERSREDKLTAAIDSNGALCEDISKMKFSDVDDEHETEVEWPKDPSREKGSELGVNGYVEVTVPDRRFGSVSENHKASSSNYTSASSSGKVYHGSDLFVNVDNGNSVKDSVPIEETGMLMNSYETESSASSASCYSNPGFAVPFISINGSLTSSWSTHSREKPQLASCSLAGNEGIDDCESPVPGHLADLSGDYDTHFNSLLYAQSCREQLLSTLYHPIHILPPSQYPNKYSWDGNRRQSMYPHMNGNGMVPGPPIPPPGCYPIRPHLMAGTYNMEDMAKPRGTGTYFPNVNHWSYKERHSHGRGRNLGSPSQMGRPRNNGRADTNFSENSNHDPPSQGQSPMSNVNDRWKPAQLDTHNRQTRPASRNSPRANGFPAPSEVKFGSLGSVLVGGLSVEAGKRVDSVGLHNHSSGPVSPAAIQRSVTNSNPERPRQSSYQLKNDDDFPPLSG